MEKIALSENKLRQIVSECVQSILLESFDHWKSQKLVDMIKQHGYPKHSDKGTNYLLTQLTDDDINGDSVTNNPTSYRYIELGDGSCVDLSKSTKNEVANDYFGGYCGSYTSKYIPKMNPNNEFAVARASNDVPIDLYSRREYKPMTRRGEDAYGLRHNPYFIDGKDKEFNRNYSWNRKEADRVMGNLRRGNDMHGKPNKLI